MTTVKVASFDSFAAFASADTADMTVVVNGRPTEWQWIFAGPGHDKTLAQTERLSKERLHEGKAIKQAQINGKKYTVAEETPAEKRKENIDYVVERLVGWTPVVIGGEDYAFSEANARALLSDPKNPDLLTQALEFLFADSSFMKRSATS